MGGKREGSVSLITENERANVVTHMGQTTAAEGRIGGPYSALTVEEAVRILQNLLQHMKMFLNW